MTTWDPNDIMDMGTSVAALSAAEMRQLPIDIDVLEVLGESDVFDVPQVGLLLELI